MATAKVEKPEMAAKKVWNFGGSVVDDADVPVTKRMGGLKLPFDFSRWTAKLPFKTDVIPVEFWENWGVAKSKITVQECRERIRRAFYNWRDAGKAVSAAELKRRQNIVVAFHENTDPKTGAFTGTEVYLSARKS